MMFRAIRIAALLVGVGVTSAPAAGAGLPSFAGLRPGMSERATMQWLHAHAQHVRTQRNPCLSELLAAPGREVSADAPGHCLTSVSATYAGADLLLGFFETLPERAGGSALSDIALNYPSAVTLNAFLTTLGSPTITDGRHPWVVALWCYDRSCRGSTLARSFDRSPGGPLVLVHRGAGLTIYDRRASIRSDAEVKSRLAARGKVIVH